MPKCLCLKKKVKKENPQKHPNNTQEEYYWSDDEVDTKQELFCIVC
tara:strand:- start:906 stop:1043 length:138 start_codon:yes stop_codon:yes gene_type:complete